MPKILITEIDETSSGTISANTDVVYIPGFVDTTQVSLNGDTGYKGLKAEMPTLFTSVSDFEALCGKKPAQFKANQCYSDLVSGGNEGFSDVAIPLSTEGIMFKQNQYDPSYIMAKECLAAGLNVVYERINPDNDIVTYNILNRKPYQWSDLKTATDWENQELFYTDGESYNKISKDIFPLAPKWFKRLSAGSNVKDSDKVSIFTSLPNVKADGSYDTDDTTNHQHYRHLTTQELEDTFIRNNTVVEEFADFLFLKTNDFFLKVSDASQDYLPTYEKDRFAKCVKSNNKITTVTMCDESQKPTDWGSMTTPFFVETSTLTIAVANESTFVDTDVDIYTVANSIYTIYNGSRTDDDFTPDSFYTVTSNDAFNPVIFTVVGDVYKCTTSDENFLYPYIRQWDDAQADFIESEVDWNTKYSDYFTLSTKTKVKLNQPTPFVSGVFYIKDTLPAISIKQMYTSLPEIFDIDDKEGLTDKGSFDFKYLTSGGYPVFEYNSNQLAYKMCKLAETRGDCVAIIDHTDNPDRTLNITDETNVYNVINNSQAFKSAGEFATMFTPWANYNRLTNDKEGNKVITENSTTRFGGSFAYLTALGDSIKTNANWLAVAGSARGVVGNIADKGMTTVIPNGVADDMQPRDKIAINAITNIRPYGNTIWGNRTLKDNSIKGGLTATSFLNIRNLVSDVKKQVYKVARQLTFEQNNDILWINFTDSISAKLDRMLTGYGISGYKIIRDLENEHAREKATICAQIILHPVYPVEDFYVTVVLKDDEVSVEG